MLTRRGILGAAIAAACAPLTKFLPESKPKVSPQLAKQIKQYIDAVELLHRRTVVLPKGYSTRACFLPCESDIYIGQSLELTEAGKVRPYAGGTPVGRAMQDSQDGIVKVVIA